MSNNQNTPSLPNSIKRDTYVGVQARETLKQLTPCNVFDLLQRSYDLAVRNGRVFAQPDGSLAFQVLGCSTDCNVIAVMRPNREPGRQPWAIVFVGYDRHDVLGTCPRVHINHTSSKASSSAGKARQKPRARRSAAPLYLVCVVWGALITPWLYPFTASALGDPMSLWALSTRNIVLAIVGLLVGVALANFASNGYKRRRNSRARLIMAMALLTPLVAVLLSTLLLGLMG